jgi:hypothetical protein
MSSKCFCQRHIRVVPCVDVALLGKLNELAGHRTYTRLLNRQVKHESVYMIVYV